MSARYICLPAEEVSVSSPCGLPTGIYTFYGNGSTENFSQSAFFQNPCDLDADLTLQCTKSEDGFAMKFVDLLLKKITLEAVGCHRATGNPPGRAKPITPHKIKNT